MLASPSGIQWPLSVYSAEKLHRAVFFDFVQRRRTLSRVLIVDPERL